MRTLVLLLGLLLVAGSAYAGTDDAADVTASSRVSCNLPYVAYDWDFAASNHGFTPTSCDGSGGAAVWAYGTESVVPGAPGNVWATVLNGNYPNNAGDGLKSPAFTVGGDSYLMEIKCYLRTETNFDGCNVKVNGQVVQPVGGYPATVNTYTTYYAYCVDNQPGFTGNGSSGPSMNWVEQCFDLSAYTGQTVEVEFDFGSDSSVSYPGWYLAYVKVGGDPPVPTEEASWGQIKATYR